MLKLLEDKFGQLVAKKVFMFLRHPNADLMDTLITQYKTCTRDWNFYFERPIFAIPPFQMSYFFAYSLSTVFLRPTEISVASLKMMGRHPFVARKGRPGRLYWYCVCNDRYEVVRYDRIQTGYNVIRLDDYGVDDESPMGYVSCVDPNVVPPFWAVDLDHAITPYFD